MVVGSPLFHFSLPMFKTNKRTVFTGKGSEMHDCVLKNCSFCVVFRLRIFVLSYRLRNEFVD